MRILVVLSSLLLAGCAASYAVAEPPIVDQRGVDPAKFQSDQAECIQTGKAFVTVGSPVTDCMRGRGYSILVPKG